MKRLITLISALFIASVAAAAVLTATWTIATTNTDGTPIAASGPGSLTSTFVEWGPCNVAHDGLASVTGSVTTSPNSVQYITPDLPVGWWCAHARHTNTFGETSAWSNVGAKQVLPPPNPIPNPPSNFSFGS